MRNQIAPFMSRQRSLNMLLKITVLLLVTASVLCDAETPAPPPVTTPAPPPVTTPAPTSNKITTTTPASSSTVPPPSENGTKNNKTNPSVTENPGDVSGSSAEPVIGTTSSPIDAGKPANGTDNDTKDKPSPDTPDKENNSSVVTALPKQTSAAPGTKNEETTTAILATNGTITGDNPTLNQTTGGPTSQPTTVETSENVTSTTSIPPSSNNDTSNVTSTTTTPAPVTEPNQTKDITSKGSTENHSSAPTQEAKTTSVSTAAKQPDIATSSSQSEDVTEATKPEVTGASGGTATVTKVSSEEKPEAHPGGHAGFKVALGICIPLAIICVIVGALVMRKKCKKKDRGYQTLDDFGIGNYEGLNNPNYGADLDL